MHIQGKMIPAAWGRIAATGADAGEIAERAANLWRGVGVVLCPVIGEAGMTALYRRSVCLTLNEHPCLHSAIELAPAPDRFATLRVALSQVPAEVATPAAMALMQTFQQLLVRLIGDPLAERLLRSAWSTPSSDHAIQGTAP